MNKTYLIKAKCDGASSEDVLDCFTEEDFENYQKGTLSVEKEAEIRGAAMELVGFDCWVEVIKEIKEK